MQPSSIRFTHDASPFTPVILNYNTFSVVPSIINDKPKKYAFPFNRVLKVSGYKVVHKITISFFLLCIDIREYIECSLAWPACLVLVE